MKSLFFFAILFLFSLFSSLSSASFSNGAWIVLQSQNGQLSLNQVDGSGIYATVPFGAYMSNLLNNSDWLFFYDADVDTMNAHIINGMMIHTYTLSSSGEWQQLCDLSSDVETSSYAVHFFYPSSRGTVFFVPNSDIGVLGSIYSVQFVPFSMGSTCKMTLLGPLPNPQGSSYFNPWTNYFDADTQQLIYMTFFPNLLLSVSVPDLRVLQQQSVDSLYSEPFAYSYEPTKRRVWTSGANFTDGTEAFGEYLFESGLLRKIGSYNAGFVVDNNLDSGCVHWELGYFFLVESALAPTPGLLQFNLNDPLQPVKELPLDNIVYQKIANAIAYIVCKN